MINPDERVARCLLQLRAPEFKPLVDYWSTWLVDTHKKLVDTQDTNQLLRLQGEGRILARILDGVQQADEMLKKLRR
jgi:hypothetical protein